MAVHKLFNSIINIIAIILDLQIIFNNDGFCDGDCDYDGGCTVGLNSDKQCGSGKSCDGAHCSGTMPVQKP